jgi:REP element-mobilizing transposase RayT
MSLDKRKYCPLGGFALLSVVKSAIMQPPVAAYHLIWTIYGYWLPNDPRGSSSRVIRSDVIGELGQLHYGRKKIQPASKDLRAFFLRARAVLKHPVVEFNDAEIEVLAEDFAAVIRTHRYTCYASAIMPDHIHLLIRKHRHIGEEMIVNFQASSQLKFVKLQLRPGDHPVWGGPGWKVYLDTEDEIRRTIKYIEDNPIQARRLRQLWPFVQAYDGWLPGGKRHRN